MKYFGILLIIALFLPGCAKKNDDALREKGKQEILQTEKDFEVMALQKGIPEAFAFYAADNGIVNNNDRLLKGKAEIKKHYTEWPYKDVVLKWAPDFVDVAASGELGYTYGKYNFSRKDTTGKVINSTGYFHTVWKKQADGSWRFVWD